MEKRLLNSEWNRVLGYAGFLSELAFFQDEMKGRLNMVKDGPERLKRITEDAAALLKDVLDTSTEAQKKKLRNIMHDYRYMLVPHLKTDSNNTVMPKEQLKTLLDIAQEKCIRCVEDCESAKNCPLYNILETTTFLNTNDSLLCPYSRAEWK